MDGYDLLRFGKRQQVMLYKHYWRTRETYWPNIMAWLCWKSNFQTTIEHHKINGSQWNLEPYSILFIESWNKLFLQNQNVPEQIINNSMDLKKILLKS